jgi:hypothetical protein
VLKNRKNGDQINELPAMSGTLKLYFLKKHSNKKPLPYL